MMRDGGFVAGFLGKGDVGRRFDMWAPVFARTVRARGIEPEGADGETSECTRGDEEVAILDEQHIHKPCPQRVRNGAIEYPDHHHQPAVDT